MQLLVDVALVILDWKGASKEGALGGFVPTGMKASLAGEVWLCLA